MIDARVMANAIRVLAIDAVQAANSGHPGMPLGMADIAQVLWCDILSHNPQDPLWINRDRVVLSNGHGSMLQYAALYLAGYALQLNDLKNFRQIGSNTPGHPELDLKLGIETTTGPLGQGLANAVGFAMAEKILAARFNKAKYEIINHFTFALVGDGCLMEGVSHEVASLAGTLQLGKLIVLWDDNNISIDGKADKWFADNTPARFKAYNWHVIEDVDGHDHAAVQAALLQAQEVTNKPSLICCKTIIGFGAASVAGTAKAHGSPLNKEEVIKCKQSLNWPTLEPFEIPGTIKQKWHDLANDNDKFNQWQELFAAYEVDYPALAQQFLDFQHKKLPVNFAENIYDFCVKEDMATRQCSGEVIARLAKVLPNLIGGSADLTGSNCTNWPNMSVFDANNPGQYIHYGVREFGMFAIMNGLALHSGFIVFGGTFVVFSDYGRNAIRLAAMMKLPVVYVLTHDSVAVGEDGPTHQPVEHVASLRLIPGLNVWRPCDQAETAVAWVQSIEKRETSALILSRQKLPQVSDLKTNKQDIAKGGYILYETSSNPELIILATGSEVSLALSVAKSIDDVAIRVVSIPCLEVFLSQPEHWRQTVLPKQVTNRLAIEAGVGVNWRSLVGDTGHVVSIESFGMSAPGKQVLAALGFSVENIVKTIYEKFAIVNKLRG